MNKVIHKVFWAWEFEKEEAWLNKMSDQGLHLVSASFCRYEFEEGEPGAYTIRLELLDQLPCHQKSADYIYFIEGDGAECVGSVVRWVYFRKKKTDGGFDLFSDIDYRIRHLKRVLPLLGIVGGVNLLNALNMLHSYFRFNSAVTLYMAALCGLLGTLVTVGFIRILMRVRKLKQSRFLHE